MKIAFTGSHGTGKTTSAFELCHKMKLEKPNSRVEIIHENASNAPKGLFNKKGTEESQLWMFTNQIRREIEASHNYNIVICDRSVFDFIAYTIYLGFVDLADKMYKLALETHIKTYDQIIFKTIEKNNFLKDCEHRDTADLEYRQLIEEYLLRLYKSAEIHLSDKFKII